MNLKADNHQVNNISKNNFSEKYVWPEGDYDKRHEVQDLHITANDENFKKLAMRKNDDLLPDLEYQVQNAEVRCDSLKQQLDYMRSLCQDRFGKYSIDLVDEKLFLSPESNTFSEEKDSMKLTVKVIENSESETTCFEKKNAVKQAPEENSCSNFPNNTEEPCVMEAGMNSLGILTSDNDFEDQSNYECKQKTFETESPMTNNSEKKKNYCDYFSNEETFQSIPNGSSNDSMKTNNTTKTNLALIQSKCVSHSVLQNEKDNTKCSFMDTYEYSIQNSISTATDTKDSFLEVDYKNGVYNPIKTVQEILNGIVDSISIISQISMHASEPGKKKHSKKHHTHNHISKVSTTNNCGNTEVLLEQETLKYFPIENTLKEMSCPDEQYFNLQERRHHHHHHHHRYCQQHHFKHQDDSMSDWNPVPATDHALMHINFCSSEEGIQSSCHFKQKRSRRPRCIEKSLQHLQKKFKVESHNSNPDVRNYNSKFKSKKRIRSEIERLIKIEDEKSLVKDSVSGRMKTLTRNSEASFRDLTETKIKHGRMRKLPVKDERQIKKIYNAKNYDSVMEMYKNDTLKHQVDSESTQMLNEKILLNTTSNNTQKREKAVKTEIRRQISCIKNDKLVRDNSDSQELIAKIENENSSVDPSYKFSPNFLTQKLSYKLKQIDRTFVNLLNFQNIPFVAGTSTSRSHNLALNLQQTLSIMKLRNASHNLGSDISSKVVGSMFGSQSHPSTTAFCTPHKVFCPVAVAQMKRSKYEIHENSYNTEYTIYGGDLFHSSVPERETLSGTMETLNKFPTKEEYIKKNPHVSQNRNVWEIDQTDDCSLSLNKELRCTCFPTRPCMEYQKLLCEYLSNREEKHMMSNMLSSRHTRGTASVVETQQKFQTFEDAAISENEIECPVYGHIQSHSKALKYVLMSLHEDFMRLNEKYKYIQNEIKSPNSNEKEARKEIGILEKELNAKEKDIVFVLELHNELKSLKQQVKTLRKKASTQVYATKPPPNKLRPESTITIRLTRLLRTIQKFQEKLLN